MTKVLVTGANGFIGGALIGRLRALPGISLRASVRRADAGIAPAIDCRVTGDLSAATQWGDTLDGVDVVIHLAARAHVLRETSSDPLSAYRQTNVEGTLALAQRAIDAGVRRFIYLSSIGVNGRETLARPFRHDDPPAPTNDYGISKLEAEQGLRRLAAARDLELVIIRPPLVYGPGVKANFLTMMRWVHAGVPLPLGAVDNRRSLVAIENLIDLIAVCIAHPAAANQVFLVSDGEDLSTPELLRRVGTALDRPARLLAVPVSVLQTAAQILGKQDIARQLCGSLQIDSTPTHETLGWHPRMSVEHALRDTASDFRRRAKRR